LQKDPTIAQSVHLFGSEARRRAEPGREISR
jgi:hypothetical protein